MNNINTVLYAGNPLGPANISANTKDVYDSNFNTILLGLFHIGRGPGEKNPPHQQIGDIVFNNPDDPVDRGVIVISGEELKPAARTWPQQLKQLLKTTSGKGNVSRIGCSVGGGGGVEDYQTIWKYFVRNGSISDDTALFKNFKALKDNFGFIDFIDFDCEEFELKDYPAYSWTQTLTAFGNMLKDIGFSITFCPYKKKQIPKWMDVLKSLYASKEEPTVLWMNLQCYDGGEGNEPADWAKAVNDMKRGIDGASFIVPGLWCCNTDKPECGSVPTAVQTQFGSWKTDKEKPVALRGGFIWNYEDILANQNSTACDPEYTYPKPALAYHNAIMNALS